MPRCRDAFTRTLHGPLNIRYGYLFRTGESVGIATFFDPYRHVATSEPPIFKRASDIVSPQQTKPNPHAAEASQVDHRLFIDLRHESSPQNRAHPCAPTHVKAATDPLRAFVDSLRYAERSLFSLDRSTVAERRMQPAPIGEFLCVEITLNNEPRLCPYHGIERLTSDPECWLVADECERVVEWQDSAERPGRFPGVATPPQHFEAVA